MENYSVNFSPKRKIVKFSQTFEVMQSDISTPRITYQKAENPIYNEFYVKLGDVIGAYIKSGSRENLSFVVTFASEKYISGLLKGNTFLIPLNFDVARGMLENDYQVLKCVGISKKEVMHRVKKLSKSNFVLRPFSYRIDNGVGICMRAFDGGGEWCTVKIRQ